MLNSLKDKKIFVKIIFGLILLICVIFAGLYQFERMTHEESIGQIGQNTFSMLDDSIVGSSLSSRSGSDSEVKKVIIHSSASSTHEYKILLADTPALRQRGLSGRPTMGDDEVMLFIFENPARNFFWMKDMLFSIDIVWLDANRKVIHIEQSVKPKTYPKSFGPDEDSKYVLEFKEGVINSVGLKVGDSIDFSLSSFTKEVTTKVDAYPATKYEVTSLILDSAFEKKYFSRAPTRCFDMDIINSGILNKAGDHFVYSEIYIVGDPSDAECISTVNSPFTVEEPLDTVVNLKTKEVIIQNPSEFNPCFGISYGECKE